MIPKSSLRSPSVLYNGENWNKKKKWLNTHTSAQTIISFKKGNSRRTSVYFNLIVLEQVVTKQPQLCYKKAKINLIVFTWTFFVLILSAGLSHQDELYKNLEKRRLTVRNMTNQSHLKTKRMKSYCCSVVHWGLCSVSIMKIKFMSSFLHSLSI